MRAALRGRPKAELLGIRPAAEMSSLSAPQAAPLYFDWAPHAPRGSESRRLRLERALGGPRCWPCATRRSWRDACLASCGGAKVRLRARLASEQGLEVGLREPVEVP